MENFDEARIRVYKFFNGETIIGYEDSFDKDNGVLYVNKPFRIMMAGWDPDDGEAKLVMFPWLEYSDNMNVQIPCGSLITVTNATADGKESYLEAVASEAAYNIMETAQNEMAQQDPDSNVVSFFTNPSKTKH